MVRAKLILFSGRCGRDHKQAVSFDRRQSNFPSHCCDPNDAVVCLCSAEVAPSGSSSLDSSRIASALDSESKGCGGAICFVNDFSCLAGAQIRKKRQRRSRTTYRCLTIANSSRWHHIRGITCRRAVDFVTSSINQTPDLICYMSLALKWTCVIRERWLHCICFNIRRVRPIEGWRQQDRIRY